MLLKSNTVFGRTILLAGILTLFLLLAGCGAAALPSPGAAAGAEPAPAPAETAIRVSTVDEFLSAIAPDTVIELAEGVYDFSTALDYGRSAAGKYYRWDNVFDEGGELVIHDVENLTIRGVGAGSTTLAAVPRYANVIRFTDCRSIRLESLTAGHTKQPGFCAGGVFRFENCRDISVNQCGLFGCGTFGIDAADSVGLSVASSEIYECTYGAVNLYSCRDVRVENCTVRSIGARESADPAVYLFCANSSDGFVVCDCRIFGNRSESLLDSYSSRNVFFLSNTVRSNSFLRNAFSAYSLRITVDGCSFADNAVPEGWYTSGSLFAADTHGKEIPEEAFPLMKFRRIDPDSVQVSVSSPSADVPAGGEISVHTADEFLAALGPDRTILLDAPLIDLSTASDYGSGTGEYYFWQQKWDGPELVIQDVRRLTIRAAAGIPEKTVISAVPRYANVLSFRYCEDITLANFTAGHTKEPGACSGGVLYFENCSSIELDSCRLYGCGVTGIETQNCDLLTIRGCEIFACSWSAVYMSNTDGISFADCDVHDVPSPALIFTGCGDKTWNGKTLSGPEGYYDVTPDGRAEEYTEN